MADFSFTPQLMKNVANQKSKSIGEDKFIIKPEIVIKKYF